MDNQFDERSRDGVGEETTPTVPDEATQSVQPAELPIEQATQPEPQAETAAEPQQQSGAVTQPQPPVRPLYHPYTGQPLYPNEPWLYQQAVQQPVAPAPVPIPTPSEEEIESNIKAITLADDLPADSGKGVRLFALLVAVIIALCAGLTGGYLLAGGAGDSSSVGNGFVGVNSTDGISTGVEVAEEGIAAAINSVVGIVTYGGDENADSSLASGIIVSTDGYVLTNDHIYSEIKGAKFIVYLNDGRRFDAEFIAGDLRSDLAVLKINATDLEPATFTDSDKLYVGQSVAAIGCPGNLSLSSTVTRGIISGVNRRISVNSNYSMKLIQTDAAINPGNSGGALINSKGEIVGVNSSKIVTVGYEGLCFAIPANVASKVCYDLINYGRVVDRAQMGITYYNIDELASRTDNLPMGLQIVSVDRDSNLYGRCTSGDIITHINGTAIAGNDTFLDIIEGCKPGDSVTLTIHKQGGADRTISIVLLEDKGGSSYKK